MQIYENVGPQIYFEVLLRILSRTLNCLREI